MPRISAILLLLLLALCVCAPAMAADPVLFEDFNDGFIDPAIWNPVWVGEGPWGIEQNGRLEITIPSGSLSPLGRPDECFSAGLETARKLVGDFDVQVEYEMLCWPPENGVRLGMWVGNVPGGNSTMGLERTSFGRSEPVGAHEWYFGVIPGLGVGQIDTTDTHGVLGLVREGNVLSMYIYRNDDWMLLYSGTIDSQDKIIGISAWSHTYAYTGWDMVRVAFDNFIVNKGTFAPAPEPSVDAVWKSIYHSTQY